MAKRRFIRRRRFGRRRRFSGRRKFLRRFVKRTLFRNTEIKWAVVQVDPPAFDANSNFIYELTPSISQGFGKDERIGNKIKYKFFQFRMAGFLALGTAPASTVTFVRIMVVMGRGQISVPPVVTDFLWNDSFLSPVLNNNCRVVLDRTMALSPIGAAQSGVTNLPPTFHIKKKVRMNNNVLFRGDADNFALDIHDRCFLIFMTNLTGANQQLANIGWQARWSFIDI